LHSRCGPRARFRASRPYPTLASYQDLLKLISASFRRSSGISATWARQPRLQLACAAARTALASNSLASATISLAVALFRRHRARVVVRPRTSCTHFRRCSREPTILKGPSNFAILQAWPPVSQLFASRRWLFRHQPTFHVCGDAKLFGFSDGFGSLQSGRQPFGLRQSLGCPGSPIVAIEIVGRQCFHLIVLTVALSGRCATSR
jgi:hypothetical protein